MHACTHCFTFLDHPYSHWLKFEPCPHSTHDHHHGHPCGCCLFDLTSSFYLFTFLLSVFLFPFFHLSDEQQPELNKKIMENLCDSAINGCEGTYDVLYLPTEPKTQCKVCLSYWNIGIVYCTCGHFLRKGRGENQKFTKYTMDLLSIPEYVIKKGRPHGHRCGKKPGDKEYDTANQLKKKCQKKFFQGIHDRFIRDETFRNRMIENGRDEDVCRQRDALADENHTHRVTPQEYYHYKSNWWLTSNKTGSQYRASGVQT